jgi:hypothetical protein
MPFRKIFSNDNDTNFNDYLKNKKGKEILKNIKSKSKNSNINKYVSYEELTLLTRTYYNYLNNENDATNICNPIPISLNDGQTSFIICEKIQDHFNTCNECFKESHSTYHNHSYSYCKELKRILYPYGCYIKNINNLKNNKIDLSKYLNQHNLPIFSDDNNDNNNEEQITITKMVMYPTLSNFIFESEKDIDYFKKQSKMNDYSIYPHNNINKNLDLKEKYYLSNSNFYNNFDQFIIQNKNNDNNPNLYNNNNNNLNMNMNMNMNMDKNTKIQTRKNPQRNIIDVAVLSKEYSNK